jgi:hypothetical protein
LEFLHFLEQPLTPRVVLIVDSRRIGVAEKVVTDTENKKLNDLLAPEGEKVSQGQPFDEHQRQEKNPDGSQQKEPGGSGKK